MAKEKGMLDTRLANVGSWRARWKRMLSVLAFGSPLIKILNSVATRAQWEVITRSVILAFVTTFVMWPYPLPLLFPDWKKPFRSLHVQWTKCVVLLSPLLTDSIPPPRIVPFLCVPLLGRDTCTHLVGNPFCCHCIPSPSASLLLSYRRPFPYTSSVPATTWYHPVLFVS